MSADSDKSILIARGRLKDARTIIARRGWRVGERGDRILCWVADHACLGYPSNTEAAVRRECRKFDTNLSDADLDNLITHTRTSNKRWSHDQSAAVFEMSMVDSLEMSLKFFGCDDDPRYERRLELKKAKKAAAARKRRAANRTGAKPGRPRLDLSAEERKARTNAQAAERMRQMRLRKIASPSKIKEIGGATQFSVTAPILVPVAPLDQRRAPKASRREPPTAPDGEIIAGGTGGVALKGSPLPGHPGATTGTIGTAGLS